LHTAAEARGATFKVGSNVLHDRGGSRSPTIRASRRWRRATPDDRAFNKSQDGIKGTLLTNWNRSTDGFHLGVVPFSQ